MYRGNIALGQTLDFKFTTRSFTTGVPTTLSGSPSLSAYIGNSTTQLTAGITLTVDFDGVTGLNNVRVVATGGNGYAVSTDVEISIAAGTVGGVSVVGEVIGAFSIENRSLSNTATQTLGALTVTGATTLTGNVVLSDGLTISAPSTGNRSGITVTGNGTGHGVFITGGNGATGNGLNIVSASTNGNGLSTLGTGTGDGLLSTGGAGAGGDGIAGIAGGGLAIRGPLDVVTLVNTLTTYTGNTVQTGDSFARIGVAGAGLTNIDLPDQTMNITGNLSGSVGSVTAGVSVGVGGIGATSFAAGAVDNAAIAADAIGSSELAASAVTEIADGLLDRADAIETGLTPRQALRLNTASIAGKLSGAATTTVVIRNAVADSKDRITATVDASGNRSAITYDVT